MFGIKDENVNVNLLYLYFCAQNELFINARSRIFIKYNFLFLRLILLSGGIRNQKIEFKIT